MNKIVLACDLGGTNLRLAAVDQSGSVLARSRRRTPVSCSTSELMQGIAEAADECRSVLKDSCEVLAVAVAVPATVDFDNGTIRSAPNVPYLDGFGMRDAVSDRFGVNAVLENDANAAAIGESWLGASRGLKSSVMLTLGTGVGGGIILNGEVLRGVDGTAGEVGHVCIEPTGPRCGCGSRGCLEQYASATGIVRIVRELSAEHKGSNLGAAENLSALDVYQAGLDGDSLALAAFKVMGRYLGIALADLINILNPEAIVIGGGAAGAFDLFIPHVREEIGLRAFEEPAERAAISRAQLGDDAGILGAAKTAFDKMG